MRFFLLTFCILFFCNLHAQYQIGSEPKTSTTPNATNLQYLNGIEDSRTIFVYKASDEAQLDELSEVIRSVWKLNDVVFMSLLDFLNYEVQDNECYVTISADYTIVYGSGGSISHLCDFGLCFWRQINGLPKYFSFSQLFPELQATLDVIEQDLDNSNVLSNLYSKYEIRNWNFGYLQSFFKDLNDNIETLTKRAPNEQFLSPEISVLKTEKLYVSESILIDVKWRKRKENKSIKAAKLFENYPYAYEIVNNQKINELVVNDEDVYCLDYIRNSRGKFFVIYGLNSGKIIYSKYKGGDYTATGKDIKGILKQIEK